MFSILKNRYIVTGQINLLGPLAISKGEPSDETDAPVMKDIHGNPFIPGSSFRGALRATVERIMAGLGRPVCGLGANPSGNDCLSVSKEEQKKIKDIIEDPSNSETQIAKAVLSRLCDTCKLFGSTYLASKLRVSDLQHCPPGGADKVVLRHRVGIDRDTETARTGAKFDGEVVEEGRFDMELILENAENADWGMLGMGMIELRNGDFWVGGDLSVGAGRCELQNLQIHLFGENGYGLNEFLQSTAEGLGRYRQKESPWTFLRGKVNSFLSGLGV